MYEQEVSVLYYLYFSSNSNFLILELMAPLFALENGYKPVATCSYAVVWLQRHPEYNGKIGNDFGGEGTCAV
jgi:hypothetical protein